MTQPEKTTTARQKKPSTIYRVRKHCAVFPPAQYTAESMVTMALVIEQMAPDRDPIELMQFMDWATGRVIGRVSRKVGMPTETELFAKGLSAIDDVCREKYGKTFAELTPSKRRSVLEGIEDGKVTTGYWSQIPSDYFYRRFYTKLLHGMFAERKEWVQIGILRSADPGESTSTLPAQLKIKDPLTAGE